MKRRAFIKAVVLNSGILAFHTFGALQANPDSIRLVMLYNNVGNNGTYKKRWGLSVWIEKNSEAVLFDVGWKPNALWHNIERSGVDVQKLSKIVISHTHRDHIYGLESVLNKLNYRPDVYVPSADLEELKRQYPKAKLNGVSSPVPISEYLTSLGEMSGYTAKGEISEHSVLITQSDAMILLTGCAHAGIVDIVKRAIELYPDKKMCLVSGGFHLLEHSNSEILKISEELKVLNVERIAPSHCTGELATQILQEQWKERYIDFGLGDRLNSSSYV